jgi:cobalt-zinc-cadmium efflux system membrane fusion protein
VSPRRARASGLGTEHDGYEATTTISINDIADVAVGDPARVTADGNGTHLDGEVVAIAIVPDSTTTSFRVTIGLNDDTSTLRNGNIGTAQLVTESTDAVVAVPNSALTPNGERSTVTVIDTDGHVTETLVQAGAAGTTWTEITQGLTAGQTVVLADYDAPIGNGGI